MLDVVCGIHGLQVLSCFLFSEELRALRAVEDATSTMREATRRLTTVVERMESAAQNGK